MRKRKFACGMLALFLVLSVAGCGKTSEEKQAANYYQKELGLDKDEAEELAHELYGKDKDEEEPSVTEAPEEIVVEPLPEIVNSEWWERKVQIYDMVFTNNWRMTEEDLRKIVAGSAHDAELEEGFNKDGNVCIIGLKVDGKSLTWREGFPVFESTLANSDFVYLALKKYGWYDDECCYHILTSYLDTNYYHKPSVESKDLDFKTRDDVLAYLAENGFVEVEEEQACYKDFWKSYNYNLYGPILFPECGRSVEYAEIPHYYCHGVQSITFYRLHKIDETDREINIGYNGPYSGARLYLYNRVYCDFNADGTIVHCTVDDVDEVMITGEKIN